jgi:S1-C subfamily serine protease
MSMDNLNNTPEQSGEQDQSGQPESGQPEQTTQPVPQSAVPEYMAASAPMPESSAPMPESMGPLQEILVEPPRKRRTPLLVVAIATAAVVGIGGLGTAGFALITRPATTDASMQNTQPRSPLGFYNQGQQQGEQQVQGGQSGGSLNSGGTQESAATPTSAADKVGVVTITTNLDYGSGAAAGTGMIVTSGGLILTNNHVVEQSTSIEATVQSTGKTYKAEVVGTDQTADVAILKLVGASGLSTVTFAPTEKVAVGQAVHSVGNAEGTGSLVTAVGTVGATNQSLSIQSDFSTTGENLSGLIELESDVVSGDSGGPLFDSSGKVIGIVTAASSGSAQVTGYAINIASVLSVASKIEAGTASTDIVIGTPAFLGIQLATTQSSTQPSTTAGVPVSGVFSGMPADEAGIAAGSVITAVDGTAVTSATQLSSLIAKQAVGDKVTIDWTSETGAAQSATVTLVGGPAA